MPLEHEYMADQLREYAVTGADAFYDTIRLDASRISKGVNPECFVQVFELF
jgi:hypothetical protein